MVGPNENFVIFLTLFVLSFFLPKFLLLFGTKPLFMLFILLIAFLILSSKIKLHMSAFLGHLQNISTFVPLVLPVSFFFSHMSITDLSLNLGFAIFLVIVKLERGTGVMILSLTVFVSLTMLSFRNTVTLSSSFTSVPPYLPPSVLNLFLDEPNIHSIIAPNPPIEFFVQPSNIFDASPRSPSNEQVEDEQVENKLPNFESRSLTLPPLEILHNTPRHLTQVRFIFAFT